MTIRILSIIACIVLINACNTKREENVVNVYSHRHYDIDKKIFKQFTESTGIEVNVVSADADELIKKLELEGDRSPADIIITVDAGRLQKAKELNLLQTIASDSLVKNIPSYFRDSENQWFALTYRARIIAYAKDRVDPSDITTYGDLVKPEWQGKVLVRSSSNIYNQSMLASRIVHDGEEAAKEWASGVVANFAREPKGNDRDQVKTVAAGVGDLAILNTYYLGLLAESDSEEERKVYESVGIIFPDQDGHGTHINISGIGVTAHAPHRENAIRFIEFMISKDVQKQFAGINHEYPVIEDVEWSDIVKSWGTFKADTLQLELLGKHNREAVRIFDQVGWK
ncbi:MAG: Fe(3+) ABC transporter substrate-binding protein [Cyclobacteriaceae bacterium]